MRKRRGPERALKRKLNEGDHLASRLSVQGDEICVIDQDQGKVDRVQDHLDVMAYQGSGVDYRLLEKCEIRKVDALIAVTDNDEVNALSCQLARRYEHG